MKNTSTFTSTQCPQMSTLVKKLPCGHKWTYLDQKVDVWVDVFLSLNLLIYIYISIYIYLYVHPIYPPTIFEFFLLTYLLGYRRFFILIYINMAQGGRVWVDMGQTVRPKINGSSQEFWRVINNQCMFDPDLKRKQKSWI